jgi:predicted alpha/beta superfamily hydrolase
LHSYKVWLAVPKNHDKVQVVMYLLDGNLVMDWLEESILNKLAADDALVLVAVGCDTSLPLLWDARSADYTPGTGDGQIAPNPRSPSRMSGGNLAFHDLLTDPVAVWVHSEIQVDSQRIGVWGHSYGGLFVLDSLLHSDYFPHYFAASPS